MKQLALGLFVITTARDLAVFRRHTRDDAAAPCQQPHTHYGNPALDSAALVCRRTAPTGNCESTPRADVFFVFRGYAVLVYR